MKYAVALYKMERAEILTSTKENMDTELDNILLSEEDDDDSNHENFIVKNFSSNKRRVDTTGMLSIILAQREMDQKRIISLTKKLSESEKENMRLETKLHYTRMDLVNAQIGIENLNKDVDDMKLKCQAKSPVKYAALMFSFNIFIFTYFLLFSH
jgi:hypothetical protein